MPAYRLTVRANADDEPVSTSLSAADEAAAKTAAALFIAEALGRPGALVLLEDDGRFTALTGFWSRSGRYELTAEEGRSGAGRLRRS